MKREFRVYTVLLGTLLSLLSLFLLADDSVAAQQIYKSNVITAKHVKVEGTHVALVPPTGASHAVTFRGFENESRGMRLEIIERTSPYESVIVGMTGEALQAEGIEVADTAKVVLNEKPATLMMGTKKISDEEDGKEGLVLFVFGNDKLSVSMYGYYPLSDRSAGSALRTSMLSVVFESGQSENSGGAYKLSAAGTSLKFKGEVNYTRRYESETADGEDGPGNALYTAVMLNKMVPQAERDKFAEETFASYMSSYEHKIAGKRSVTHGGLPGIEIVADFEGASRRSRTASGGVIKRSVPAKGYQTVLFDDAGRVFVFQGVAVRDADAYLSQFQRITSSFALVK